jgi:hypothetical protein
MGFCVSSKTIPDTKKQPSRCKSRRHLDPQAGSNRVSFLGVERERSLSCCSVVFCNKKCQRLLQIPVARCWSSPRSSLQSPTGRYVSVSQYALLRPYAGALTLTRRTMHVDRPTGHILLSIERAGCRDRYGVRLGTSGILISSRCWRRNPTH